MICALWESKLITFSHVIVRHFAWHELNQRYSHVCAFSLKLNQPARKPLAYGILPRSCAICPVIVDVCVPSSQVNFE